MSKRSLRLRARYRFDTMIAGGTVAVIAWLGIITFIVVFASGVILSVADIGVHHEEHPGIIEGIWQNMLRTLEPAAMENDLSWPLRIQSLLVVLFGILVGSSLIGLLVSGIDRRVTELRRGRSTVLEEGHTLVLGWSDMVFPIIGELVLAHRGRRSSAIVVLAPHDKVELEEEIRARIPNLGRTRVVCRSGNPSDPSDLALTSPYEASSVIVVGSDDGDGDAQAIRTVLALMKDPRFEDLRVVVHCVHPENAESLREATAGHAITIASSGLIARVTAQSCRHTGLGTVFKQILDFEGEDVQLDQNPALVGQPFGSLVLAYGNAAAMGIRCADGTVTLNPPDDRTIIAGESVIILGSTNQAIALVPRPATPPVLERRDHNGTAQPSRVLVVGWNTLGPLIIDELDKWFAPGSVVHVLIDENLAQRSDVAAPRELQNIDLSVTQTRRWDPHRIAEVAAGGHFDRVLVLCYRHGVSPAEADARALMTLLQLRELRRLHPEETAAMSVVTEVLDLHDVELARVAGAQDFIVSERLAALMLAQLAEVPEREQVFADLFDASGSEISMRHVSDYATPRPDVPWASYVVAAHAVGHLALGYRLTHRVPGQPDDGIVLNPPKTAPVDLGPDDRLIVLVRHQEPVAASAPSRAHAVEA
jgi:voltage-gated potassium channel Kch